MLVRRPIRVAGSLVPTSQVRQPYGTSLSTSPGLRGLHKHSDSNTQDSDIC